MTRPCWPVLQTLHNYSQTFHSSAPLHVLNNLPCGWKCITPSGAACAALMNRFQLMQA